VLNVVVTGRFSIRNSDEGPAFPDEGRAFLVDTKNVFSHSERRETSSYDESERSAMKANKTKTNCADGYEEEARSKMGVTNVCHGLRPLSL
jgi:hypothetical protein